MNRRTFLRTTAAVGTAPYLRAQNRSAERPSILFLMADQHRHDAIACAGNRWMRTPNLDRLAASGVRFTHALTPTPVCVAARMSLITGHRASRTHWVHNGKLPGAEPALPTLMTLLAGNGYRTHAVGKMHFRGLHYGLQRHESMEESVPHRIDDDYLTYLAAKGIRTRYPQGLRDLLYFQPQTSGMPLEHAQSTWVADRSIAFLRQHRRYRGDQPFFLWASWIAPHPPFAPCEPYDSMYRPQEMPLPDFADRPLTSLAWPAWGERARLDGAHLDPGRMRRLKALYYGQISHVDDALGRVLAELETSGLAKNTVVVYFSDHGEMMGDHGLSQKSVPYEPSVRVPLTLRWPGRTEAGRVSSDLAGLTDLVPTFVEGLRMAYPATSPPPAGESLLGVEGGGLASRRDAYYSDYGSGSNRWISMRTRTHKFVLWASAGREELFDLEADPRERRNLAHVDPRLAAELKRRLLTWEREHGLAGSFEQGAFKAYPEPPLPAGIPRNVIINEGRWPDNLPPGERQTVESYADAFTRAVSKETELTPEKLSLSEYKKKGGRPLLGTPWEDAWRKA